jgi:hypothetical protein
LLEALSVGVQQPRPKITGCAQQPVAAIGLSTGDMQTDPGGAMHQPRIQDAGFHSELMFGFGCSTVKVYWRSVDRPGSGSNLARLKSR